MIPTSPLRSTSAKRKCHEGGMTLLEVLIAILLFAVFSGTFLVVTEMIAQLFPRDKAPLADNSCNGPSLEAACINLTFDAIVPALELYDPLDTDISAEYASINQMDFAGIADSGLAWPDSYRLEIIQYPYLRQSAASEQSPSKPGLYLLQATPTNPAFWRKPIQRVFCRPYHVCTEVK